MNTFTMINELSILQFAPDVQKCTYVLQGDQRTLAIRKHTCTEDSD